MADHEASGRSSPANGTSRWEWLAGFVSALVVAALIVFLLLESRTHGEGTPNVEVVVDTVAERPGGHVVGFTATNRSPATASGLAITGELVRDSGVVESSSVTLDYLPPGGSRTGGLFFSENPAEYEIHIDAEGYLDP